MHEKSLSVEHLELWAGVEATVNRVGDRYFDQMEFSGHALRCEDLALVADLGIQVLRYPVLWERVAPHGIASADWGWTDRRLGRLRELGIRPIAGLLHHGSGPRGTNLLDPAFPELLADYAGAVANRYPWLRDYTPVNEPLTTARFSALYGHWHPHAHDDRSFARALINQCRGIVLAMQAIQAVNPRARLIQTDDPGRTCSTPTLAYQAEFENERRWITFDLLTGRLTPSCRMWGWLTSVGIDAAELEWFRAHPCPPSVIGINHYLSSERFLDERLDRYPGEPVGSNGRHRYVDVVAARAAPDQAGGLAPLLREAWVRFQLPLAVTEAHNSGPREEQLRWLDEVWDTCEAARDQGMDLRAVTVWSLLGAYDWGRLVTRDDGIYEPGVFDVRSGAPRPTALAALVKALAAGDSTRHPVLATPGWWKRIAIADRGRSPRGNGRSPSPLAVLDDHGALARLVTQTCTSHGRCLDLTVVDRACAADAGVDWSARPWAVIDANMLGAAENAFDEQTRVHIAATCERLGIPLLTFASVIPSELKSGAPQASAVGACPAPVEPASEELLRQTHAGALIVRIDSGSAIVRSGDLHARDASDAADPDRDLASVIAVIHAALDLLIDGESGVWEPSLARTDAPWLGLARATEAVRLRN